MHHKMFYFALVALVATSLVGCGGVAISTTTPIAAMETPAQAGTDEAAIDVETTVVAAKATVEAQAPTEAPTLPVPGVGAFSNSRQTL